MRYRGLNIEHQLFPTEIGNTLSVVVYDGNDDLRKHPLLEMNDIIFDSNPNNEAINIVDDCYGEIDSNKNYYTMERFRELLGRAVTVIAEEQSPERLYETLTDNIGLSDDEIRRIGFTDLAPFFDRDGYAQTIAEFITDYGTEETTTGNYLIPFEEINKRFGVDLFHDEELLDKIMDSFDWDVVSSLDISDGDFDLTFYTDYCPQCFDEFTQDWG